MTVAAGGDIHAALSGVTAVLVTPYREGRVDEPLAEWIARSVSASGIHAVAALGNTAEVFQLTDGERRAYLRAVARGSSGVLRIGGFAGAAKAVLEQIADAALLGYDIAMLHEPADPFGDSDGLVSYYLYVAARSPLPLVLYLRSERLGFDALRLIAAEESIIGVKYARPDLDTLARLLATDAGERCTWVNGAAEMRAPDFLRLGLTGFTSGIANVRPDLARNVHAALVARDSRKLRDALVHVEPVERLRAAGNGKFNVAVLKELFRAAGTDVGDVRPPHSPLSPEAVAELHEVISTWPRDPRATGSDASTFAGTR